MMRRAHIVEHDFTRPGEDRLTVRREPLGFPAWTRNGWIVGGLEFCAVVGLTLAVVAVLS